MISKASITDFLAVKNVSETSKKSYYYDLAQFLDLVDGAITETSLLYYQEFLKSLKISAQKRKSSSVNQFLLYLYDSGELKHYYRLRKVREQLSAKKEFQTIELHFLNQESEHVNGRLIASLIGLLGLTIKEIASLTGDMIDREYQVLKVIKDDQLRILPLPQLILQLLPDCPPNAYLFGRGEQGYSRQWFFLQLKTYLTSVGLQELTAQALRQQYIHHQKALGKDAREIAKSLGLKSTQTIEKYFN